MTPSIVGVQWNQVLLYPAGTYARAMRVAARVKLPPQWQQASALRDAPANVPQAGMPMAGCALRRRRWKRWSIRRCLPRRHTQAHRARPAGHAARWR
jgi:hypothetical protein